MVKRWLLTQEPGLGITGIQLVISKNLTKAHLTKNGNIFTYYRLLVR